MEAFLFVALVLTLVIITTILAPLLVSVAIVRWMRGRSGGGPAAVVASLLLAGWLLSPIPRLYAFAAYLAVPQVRLPLARLDLALSRGAREDIVRRLAAGDLAPSDRGGFVLPPDARGLSVHGVVEQIADACGARAFFMTVTGFSPDPYAGFEFVPRGCEPEPDPLGSGHGEVRPLTDGWFWIEAR